MQNETLRIILILLGLLIITLQVDAAIVKPLDASFLDDIQDKNKDLKLSEEILEGFRLSKNGLHKQAFQKFTIAAEREELTAYLALGGMYREGRGTPQNIKLAKENFKKASDKGNEQAYEELMLLNFASPENPKEFAQAKEKLEQLASDGMAVAQIRLAMAHLSGHGYSPDAKKAIDYLSQAAASKGAYKSKAAFILSKLYRDGNLNPEIKPDAKLAESWLKKAAEEKHLDAIRALGEFYLNSDPAKQNFTEARKWFTHLAELGEPTGLYYLGQMSENGWGVDQSLESAAAYYTKAAKKEEPSAIYRLGSFYENGLGGMKKDSAKATEYYRKGAALGHPFCMFNLAIMLDDIEKRPEQQAEVMHWLVLAAATGLVEAEYQIGYRYQQGRGVTRDFVAAAAWFDRASRNGHAKAQLHLGEMYQNGLGVKKNLTSARRLFELSAKKGSIGGKLKYAEVLANGIGGKKDFIEAYFYAASAAGNIDPKLPTKKMAVQLRDDISMLMTPEQLSEAKKRLDSIKELTK